MNIFYLDRDPDTAARMHCNKRVGKMTLETAQMLCNARHVCGLGAPYRPTHINHPCCLWVRESIQHYRWLCLLGVGLAAEFTSRSGGKIHASEAVIRYCMNNPPDLGDRGFVDPPQCMPEKYRGSDTVDAYRRYWTGEKLDSSTWPEGRKPYWVPDSTGRVLHA